MDDTQLVHALQTRQNGAMEQFQTAYTPLLPILYMSNYMFENTVKGAMFGLIVGDALGIPVEFQSQVMLEQDPVNGLFSLRT